jgi:hypothetical protein
MGLERAVAKRKGSLRLIACLKIVIFAKTGFYKHLSRLTLHAIDEGLFLQIHLSMCAPKIGAAPVAGQALLPKITLRCKVSLGKTLC